MSDDTHGNFSTLSNWIAINPVLARYLGWYPLSGKLFAWADEVGNCLVESVYWMDSNIKMQPPHLYSEAGEGWYVLATDQAMAESTDKISNQLRTFFNQIYDLKFNTDGNFASF